MAVNCEGRAPEQAGVPDCRPVQELGNRSAGGARSRLAGGGWWLAAVLARGSCALLSLLAHVVAPVPGCLASAVR
jgi:hypothetical protein